MSYRMASKKILSLSKLSEVLASKSYTLVSVYYDVKAETIVFLEARTPKVQKTFIVAIPPKYKMKMDISNYKRIDISPKQLLQTEKQTEFLSEIKGVLLDCDIMAISSTTLCLQKNNGVVLCYGFGILEENMEEDSNESSSEQVDAVDQILSDAKKIEELVDPVEREELILEEEPEADVSAVVEDASKETNGEIEDASAGDGVDADPPERKEGEDEEQVELEFDIAPVTKDVVAKDMKEISKKIIDPKKKSSKPVVQEITILPQPKKESLKQRKDNSIPPDIQESDLSLGIIYYSIDLDHFYKKINPKLSGRPSDRLDFETEILGVYDAIDDNEEDMRISKLDEITELALKVVQKSKDNLEAFKKEELNLKTQILKLSTVLDQTDALKLRISKTPAKFTDTKPEIDRLRNQTKTTLHEINIELLKNRDLVEDLLSTTKTSLEEILDM